MISSVLVANRGEIAVRIFSTCRRLGVRTIAVYSDADAQAQHVADADEAYHIGPPPAAESYLNQAAILDAARAAQAQAIHPGYGFLAENADFAQRCIEAGFIWVGPPSAAMRALGDKAHARALAERNGVPLLVGVDGADQAADRLGEHARRIGFPLMIKAAAGGGGRGMRVVESPEAFAAALQAARREARASFGDERVILERYVRRPRHVEVQILGDRHGHLVHLGERECSIQRRHQKLIEETPSPAVDPDLRSRMVEAALTLARAANYASAGTVEFLVDEDGGFAFLEVNTRLQVEHPITEAVTGLDLVELQLRIADGEPLPFEQHEVRFEGHAIEARVIAEDPLDGFLPSSGTIESFWCPPWVRLDTWVAEGTSVSPYYDSLLAKVVSHSSTRAEAARRLADALTDMRVEGVKHNVDLLLDVLQHPAFTGGELSTAFLDEHHVVESLGEIPAAVLAAASAVDGLAAQREQDPWRARSGWRIGRVDQPATWSRAGRSHAASVSAEPGGDGVRVDLSGESRHVRLLTAGGAASYRVSVDGRTLTVRELDAERRIVASDGRAYRLERPRPPSVDEAAAGRGRAAGSGRLTAPMPGRVVSLTASMGEHVSQHQPLVVLEAMKMEHVIEAPRAGIVTAVHVRVGDQVTGGAELLSLGSSLDSVQEGAGG